MGAAMRGFCMGQRDHKEEGDVVFRRLHCREGFCFDNGVDQFPVAKRIIFYGRNECELSVEELFLVWRSERFRKYKIGLLRSFLSGLLMLIFGRQGYKILVEAEGGCDRVNMDVGTITAASTHSTVALVNVEGRNHAIYALGKDTR
ncbi:hypothetical protein V6N11_065316 [Hibiscus sabdariffa]|uniref:Uncharacterized protein n=1 Tax=Hibiscus sabdariffa TaxID=183260 RepID=A0ABR2QGK2_9ROSI